MPTESSKVISINY